MIVTFYSFKGGVGRTLALANVGVVLAQSGHRVLAVDFDLEAPGLIRYLEKEFGGDLQRKRGLLELLEQQRDAGNAADHLGEYAVEIVRNAKGGVLELLTSGNQDESYPKRVLDFDWSEFFMNNDGGKFFEHCRQEWAKQYDYVLIDSRTGITDSGGVCTIQLPDIIVPVFTASRQSVDGVIDVVRRAQEGRQLLAYDRAPAAIVPLPSRFDSRTEYTLSQQWLDEFAVRFKEFYKSWLPKEIPARQVLERTKLPYVAFFSFGERLPVFEESGSDPESLGYALRTFARLLESSLQDASSLVAGSGGTADHGETVTLPGAGDQAGRAGLSIHQQLTEAAQRWDRDGRPGSALYRDTALAVAQDWAQEPDHHADLGKLERDFLAASQALRSRQKQVSDSPISTAGASHRSVHRLRQLIAGLVVLLILSLAGGITLSVSHSTSPQSTSPQRGPITVLAGHTDIVDAVAFSPDGHTLASASYDQTVRLWNVTDSAHPTPLGQPLTGHTNSVTAVAFNPDGRTLATGSADRTVRLWDVTDLAHPTLLGQPLTGHTNSVFAVAFNPDGRTLATGSTDRTVRLWNVTNSAHPTPLGQSLTGHTDRVFAVAFSPDGRTLATGSADHTVRLWNVTDSAHPTPLGQNPSTATPASSPRWRSAPMGIPWPAAATTIPCDCGASREPPGCPPSSRAGPSSACGIHAQCAAEPARPSCRRTTGTRAARPPAHRSGAYFDHIESQLTPSGLCPPALGRAQWSDRSAHRPRASSFHPPWLGHEASGQHGRHNGAVPREEPAVALRAR